jgi:hypothetical protein
VVHLDVSDVAREMDVRMLTVSYKIKGLALNELWFASKLSLSKISLLGFYCYRDTLVKNPLKSLKKEVKYTLVNDLSLEKDAIFSAFKSNVRNEIRKCEKIETFSYESNHTNKEVFLEFYSRFAEAKKLVSIEERAINKYGQNLFYVSASLNDSLTNMQVYLIDKESEIVRLLHSISTLYEEKDKHRRAEIGWVNRYLHWQTILHFKALNFKTFDWGGYTNDPHSGLAGIDKFKASFGGKKVELYNYYTLPYYCIKRLQEKFL